MSDNSEIKNVEAAPGKNITEHSLVYRTFFGLQNIIHRHL